MESYSITFELADGEQSWAAANAIDLPLTSPASPVEDPESNPNGTLVIFDSDCADAEQAREVADWALAQLEAAGISAAINDICREGGDL